MLQYQTSGSASRHSGPIAPRISTCAPAARAKILEAHGESYRWAEAARRWMLGLVTSGQARSRWTGSEAAKLFGPFSAPRVKHVAKVFIGLVRRFQSGYEIGGQHRAPTIGCFPASYGRCKTGLLGNASIFGTIRLCPRLIARPAAEVAAVVLHEMMHQGLGVGDRRHEMCEGSKNRCYREGADALVGAGRHDLAIRNIDNYVAFARTIASRSTATRRS
jgi:hypothetical protein